MPLLSGPLTLSVHLGDLAQLPTRLKARRDVSVLLDFIDVAVTAEVKDPNAFVELLQRSKAKLGERGIKIRARPTEINLTKTVIFEPDTASPRLGWAVMPGNPSQYVYGVGAGRLEATLKLLSAGNSDHGKSLAGSVGEELARESGTSVLIVRLGALATAAAAIPLGNGKAQAMGVEVMVGGILELLRTVGDVAAAVSAEPDGLRLRIRERLQ